MLSLDVVDRLLQSSHSHTPRYARFALLLVIGLLIGAVLARPDLLSDHPIAQILIPQVALIGLIVWVAWRSHRQRVITSAVRDVWEALQYKDWDRAERILLWLLGRPLKPKTTRWRALMSLTMVADRRKQYDISRAIIEAILQEPDVSYGQRITARVVLAGTLLQTDQLTDAVETIERLNRETLPPPLQAQVELLNLFRFVRMGQADEALQRVDERRALFRRHLGTRAGYGYALLAAAYDRAGQTEQAADLWRDATALIHADELMDRFRDLAPIAGKYEATVWPI